MRLVVILRLLTGPVASGYGSIFLTWQLLWWPFSVLWFGEVLLRVSSFSPSNDSVDYLDLVICCSVLKLAREAFCNVQLRPLSNEPMILSLERLSLIL